MAHRILEEDRMCFGFPCKGGTEVDDFERSGTLARSVTYRGIELPEGSRFGRDCDFDYLWVRLATDAHVHGHAIPAGSRLELSPFPPPLSSVYSIVALPFYPLVFARSLGERNAQRVKLNASTEVQVAGHIIAADERFELDKAGHLLTWKLKSPRIIQGLDLQTGWLHFDRGGAVREVMLYRSQTLFGLPCFGSGLAGTEVRLHEDGNPARLVLAEDATVDGTSYVRGTRLHFSTDDRVSYVEPMKVDVALYSMRPEE